MAMPTSKEYEVPTEISRSGLWKRISERTEYAHTIAGIRKIARALGEKIASAMPEYTDHSVEHMDSLWGISGQVLSETELGKFTSSEAFVLGAAFYLHDLGMASTVTAAGQEKIRSTEQYRVALARFGRLNPPDPARADTLALCEATRELHATKAMDLATSQIPGLDQFLIEDTGFRGRWAFTVGQIGASHHWSMEEVERTLGACKITPGPDGENLDLGYLACVLRVIDFAHIDQRRAPRLERLLRSQIPKGSQVHWDAQENITGPIRDGDYLVFGCTQPITTMDAWWLFYDLSSGLDSEIRGVHEYLRNRTASKERFSLKGVKAVETPSAFSEYVRLAEGVVPIDIRVQPDSMERVVELLGGRHIYGQDDLAPIRELIQNARDAIGLRQALERAEGRPQSQGEISVSLTRVEGNFILSVRDNGVGMTRSVVRKHLVGVGSDFWNSLEFYRDYRKAIDAGFKPIGKFGIGFLSVFMLGDHIEVETEALGNNRIRLTLDGLGKRGELRETKATGMIGSEVRVTLKQWGPLLAENLAHVVRARAPMLTIPIVTNVAKDGSIVSERIEPGWWKRVSEEILSSFLRNWLSFSHKGKAFSKDHSSMRYHYGDLLYPGSNVNVGGKWAVKGWPGAKPQHIDESRRLLSMGGQTSFGVVVCSQGIAVELLRIPDITGLVEAGEVELTASRESIAEEETATEHGTDRSKSDIAQNTIEALIPAVVARVDEIHTHGMIPGRIGFLRAMASVFGDKILYATKLKWIPVTLPPGNLIHHSRQELADELKGQNRILLAVGISPGGAYAVASSHISTSELGQMMVLSVGSEEIEVPYSVQQQFEFEGLGGVLKGTLDHMLSVISDQTKSKTAYAIREPEDIESALVLTKFLLGGIAETWGMSTDDLRKQSWYLHYKDNALYGDLRRAGGPDMTRQPGVLPTK
jgi:hypothetical protein